MTAFPALDSTGAISHYCVETCSHTEEWREDFYVMTSGQLIKAILPSEKKVETVGIWKLQLSGITPHEVQFGISGQAWRNPDGA